MDVLLLIIRVALAGVFIASGIAKLLDREGGRQAVSDFGIPDRFAGPIAIALPFVELAVALLLIPRDTAWWGALGALALLVVFSAEIAYNLSRGNRPDCHCFGQLSADPISPRHLIRNGVLGLLALLVVARGQGDQGSSVIGWADDLSGWGVVALIGAVLLVAALATAGWLLVHLLGQNGRLLVRLDAIEETLAERGMPVPAPAEPVVGLKVGAPAPSFSLTGLYGETMTLDALRSRGQSTLLLFSDPSCGPCTALMPDIGAWQREHAGKLTVALVGRGTPEENRAKTSEHGLVHVLLQKDREVAQAYEANGTPAAVIVRSDGTIGSPLALGADAIRALVARSVGAPAPTAAPSNGAPARSPGLAIGQPAPALELPDLDGTTVRLADMRDRPTLLLFWNPGCGFCVRMAEDLKAWEQESAASADAARALIVSTGDVQANRDMGLSSTIVLDQGFATGRSFGAAGTPSAVLVDTAGNIASAVAVGAPGVLALARGEDPAAAAGAPPAERPAASIGDEAPDLRLTNLDGESVEVKTLLQGTRTLVLFWNPGCGFCARMLDDLKAWEASPPKNAPKLLVISTGTAEANRELGLRSPVLLDDSFGAGQAFGASGTPSGILVDARGRIASDLAVGAPAVFDLANRRGDRLQMKSGPR